MASKEREVFFSNEAKLDLSMIIERIAVQASDFVALSYLARIESFCWCLLAASERESRRDDLWPGLRIVGFEKRLTIAFAADDDSVTILRIFAAGKNWTTEF